MNEQVYDLGEGWNRLTAEVLYAVMDDVSAAEIDFYERRTRENGGPAPGQACGTGRHLFLLNARGLEVHGADISSDVLKYATRARQKLGVRPVLFHQRMEECDIPHRYGTIYVANGTFQIIVDRQKAFRALELFLHHLSPGGQLLIELPVPEVVISRGGTFNDAEHPLRWDPTKRPDTEGEIATTLWTESVDFFEQILLAKRRCEIYLDGKCVRSEIYAHYMRWYFHHEFQMMLERVGYDDIRTYSDFTDRAATNESKTVVYGARRPLDAG